MSKTNKTRKTQKKNFTVCIKCGISCEEVNEFDVCKECECKTCGGLGRVTIGDRETYCKDCSKEPDFNDIDD